MLMEMVFGIVVEMGTTTIVRSARRAGVEGSGEGFRDDSESERKGEQR